MSIINRFLERVNEESGKTENRFSLEVLEKKLSYYKKSQDIVSYFLPKMNGKILIKLNDDVIGGSGFTFQRT
jgi:hypothetical protein